MTSTTLSYDRSTNWTAIVGDYLEMARPRIAVMIMVTVAVVAEVAAWGQASPLLLFHLLTGTVLVAASASVANQVYECRRDSRMRRTADRPLPAGRISLRAATIYSALAGLLGTAWLAIWVNLLTAGIGLAVWVIYVGAYTPLKTITPHNTLVGAVVGAMPVLMGWAAAEASWNPVVDLRWIALFTILFLWQFPHFMAIAWLYRSQYAEAGMKMWPVVDPSGRRAGMLAVLSALGAIPVSFVPGLFWSGEAAVVFLAIALLLGGIQLVAAIRFMLKRNDQRARHLLLATLVYLPLLLLSMVGIPLLL
jgi:protoheme IX farnesyltransferase